MGSLKTKKEVEFYFDDQDIELISKHQWHLKNDPSVSSGGYIATNIKTSTGYKSVTLHRLVLGDIPKGMQIDHIDRNTLNNRRSNLRIVTPLQNVLNRESFKGSSSKYKGVAFEKDRKRWKASICVNGVLKNLGRYKVERDAAIAYNQAAKKYFPDQCLLNEGV